MRIQYNKYIIKNTKNINIKIAHISDIHFSHKYNNKRLEMVVNKIKDINPNYICITGDLIDLYDVVNDVNYPDLKNFINNLSNIGKVIITVGNHEYIKMLDNGFGKTNNIEWLKELQTKNIIALDNEIYEENNISFIGYNPDYDYYYTNKETPSEKNNEEISKLINKTKNNYKILLSHTPFLIVKKDNYKNIKKFDKIDLVLSGHTHGGLIPSFIPGNFGIISPNRKIFPKKVRGIINLKTSKVIISSGIMKLSRKSKLAFLNDIYGSNITEITIKHK